jgi:hypothetical protein
MRCCLNEVAKVILCFGENGFLESSEVFLIYRRKKTPLPDDQ